MPILPFMEEYRIPVNYIPVCPSSSQVLRVEKKRYSIRAGDAKNCPLKAEALISEFDKFASGEMSCSNTFLSPEEECLCGKMYFIVEFLRQIEQQTLGYTLITIITTNADVQEALFTVIRHYTSLQVIRLPDMSLRGGHGEGTWVGGVTVHIKSSPNQQLHRVALSDLVLAYDADLVGLRLSQALLAIPFDCNPILLHLCTFGTPETAFLDYFLEYARKKRVDHNEVHHEVVLKGRNDKLLHLLEKEIAFYTDEEFKIWNDSIAQQVAHWFMYGESIDYIFKPLNFPSDVPKKYLQPPKSDF